MRVRAFYFLRELGLGHVGSMTSFRTRLHGTQIRGFDKLFEWSVTQGHIRRLPGGLIRPLYEVVSWPE